MFLLVTSLRRRLQRKLVALAPLVIGALLLVGVLSLLAVCIEPFLPQSFRSVLHQARQGDWQSSRASLRALFAAAGDADSAVFVLLQILQVVVAPLPAPVFGLLGGALFGFWSGLGLSVLGLGIGSAIAMGASRVLGDAVVRRCVPPPLLARFDDLAGANGLWSFLLIYLLPMFPDDAVCFMAGLTRFPLHRLLVVCIVGRLPGIAVLTFVGSGTGGATTPAYVVLAIATLVAFGVWLFSEDLETVLVRAGAGQHALPGKNGNRVRR